ncbi:MAG: site-2 protease family protein [Candidatus Daviesbacteria bacterium]|nr:site-2 protease family protein [Candidatus Daviesbacteria bacterium]
MEPVLIASSIVILLFSVIIHEVMHGVMALKFGDRTAENAGRLTLNPIPHIDPIGTILVPTMLILSGLLFPGGSGFIIGWAKPVPVNPLNFSNIRKGELYVSLAGVGSNFALAIFATIIYHLYILLSPLTANLLILEILSFTVTINLLLGIFNLLPIPPLDGSKVLMSRLPTKLAIQYQSLEKYGMLILLFLWFVPIAGVPILGLIISLLVNALGSILGVPLRLF